MKDVKYSFSSVQINLPNDLSKKIIAWGKNNIDDDIIFRDPTNPSFGRENEIHVTVLYGIHSKTSKDTRMVVKSVKPFTIKLGEISIFDTSDLFDVVKIEVKSPELHNLNKLFCNKITYTNKYKGYKPHVTIAYVKHGKGKQYVGKTPFVGKTFEVDHIMFSSREGKKECIKLNESVGNFTHFMEGFDFK
jgi:hypothetical protein